MVRHVVSVGGGLSSTYKLLDVLVPRVGRERIHAVTCWLPNEHPDMRRLYEQVQAAYGVPVWYIGLNKTPWDVFFERRFLGNTRVDVCSATLKRDRMREYMVEHFDPAETLLYVGICRDELHRMVDIQMHWAKVGFRVAAPLVDLDVDSSSLPAEFEARFGWLPEMYRLGFHHHNCHGACIKAGQYEWARLLYYYPDVYAWWEANEDRFDLVVGPHTILRDRRGGVTNPLRLSTFRRRMQAMWASCLPGLDFDLLPGVRDLSRMPACAWCSAA